MRLLPRILVLGVVLATAGAQAGTTGLLGEYYNLGNFRNENGSPPIQRVDFLFQDTAIAVGDLPTGFTADTANLIVNETITIQWSGMLEILPGEEGNYSFQMRSDDGSRLWIDGQLLLGDPASAGAAVNSWRDQGVTQVYTNTKNLSAGFHSIIIQLQQGGGGVGIDLNWTKPNGTTERVPDARFTPASATQIPGGVLAVTQAATPATVDLTSLGTLDWVHFGAGNNRFAINRKQPAVLFAPNNVGSNVSGGGDGLAGFDQITSTPSFVWTNGTPTATQAGTTNGVRQDRDTTGSGLVFAVPADTTPRRILVYTGTDTGNIRVEAKLSDFSAAAFTAINVAATTSQVFDMRFRAASNNQMLLVRVTAEGTNQGRIHAVTANLSAPQSTGAIFNINEDTTQNFTLNFTDADGGPNPNQVTITTPLTNGTLTGPLTGTLTYTPNANFNGTDSFTYIVNDGLFSSTPVTVTFNIAAVNDGPPVLVNDTASTPDNVPVNVNILANDTIADTPFTVSLVGQPANGTAVLNANNTITYTGDLSFVGTDIVTYQVTDADGQTATATLTINVTAIPPNITSPLAVNAIQGLPFTYRITSDGTLPITYTAAPLPSGLILVGDTIQGFVSSGSYAVTLSATNLTSTDVKTLVINCIVLVPNADTDGDGFTDEFEIGVGSSPVDPTSTPFTVLRNGVGGIPPGIPPPGGLAVARPFFLSKLGIKLDFRSTKLTRDAISFKGTLPVPSSFTSAIQAVAANVGGVTLSGTLDSRGNYTSLDKRVKIKVGKTRTSLAGANAPISVTARGVYAQTLGDEGYANVTISKQQGSVVIFVTASTEYFTATASTEYSARINQKGSVKTARVRR